jgi:endonuclease/exonuclease/phosphatase family metal-dependent hydrolase
VVIKILSYNIHKGRSFFLRHRIWNALDSLVHTVEPDIVFLQEFLIEPQAERLLEKFADKLWPHYSFGQNATMGDYRYGNAILSKFPFVETHSTDISNSAFEKRGLLYGKVKLQENQSLYLFCSHLDLTHNGRKKQIHKIEKVTSTLTESHDQVIMAGDFNDWDNRLHHQIEQTLNFKEVSASMNGFLMATSPSIYPKFSLDRIYYRNLKAISNKVLSNSHLRILSDHLPVISEFEA